MRVSPEHAKQLLESQRYVYLDVRSVPEFDGGHPAGAYNVPLMHMASTGLTPNPDFLAVVALNFSTTAKLVVGCRSGGRSVQAAQTLRDNGYEHVLEMTAGFAGTSDAFGRKVVSGWQDLELPVRALPEAGRSYAALLARLRPDGLP